MTGVPGTIQRRSPLALDERQRAQILAIDHHGVEGAEKDHSRRNAPVTADVRAMKRLGDAQPVHLARRRS
jgi:hypothetical protein